MNLIRIYNRIESYLGQPLDLPAAPHRACELASTGSEPSNHAHQQIFDEGK